jgi:transketolase
LVALNSAHTPSVLALSRQNLPQLESSTIERAAKGGYIVHDVAKSDLILVSTGSEVSIAIEAAKILSDKGIQTRVVSFPCFEVFDAQSREYQLSVLPDGVPILSVEAYSVSGSETFAFVYTVTNLLAFNRRLDGLSTATSNLACRRLVLAE